MTEEKKPTFEDFKEYFKQNPDMDNAEYYAAFPEVHNSTIRSWKTRIRPLKPDPQETPEARATWDDEMVKLLCTQTGTPLNELEGLDSKSQILVLKNKLKNIQTNPPKKKNSASNAPILPSPKPIGQNKKTHPIDPYIVFDDVKNEIRMEFPMDILMDPEKNRELRGEKENRCINE